MESLKDKEIILIKEAIMEVIAFFDLFDYPLTEFELMQYLGVRCSLLDIKKVLNKSKSAAEECFSESNGFYFLRGRKEIIKTKMQRYNYSDKKFKKAMLVSRFFKIIPWIRMIAVGNLIGSHNLKKQGDIDLFIITKKHRVWITRFFCAGFAQLFGLRPTEKNTQDKICLSFFVSEEAMDLEGLMLDKFPPDFSQSFKKLELTPTKVGQKFKMFDIYFIYWLAGLVPIYNKDNTYSKFIKTNSWLIDYLPNWRLIKVSPVKYEKSFNGVNFRRDSGKGFSSFYENFVDLLIGGIEKTIKKVQLKKFPDKLKSRMNKDTRVVINDNVLKLYANDRREEYRNMWKEKLSEIEMAGWVLR